MKDIFLKVVCFFLISVLLLFAGLFIYDEYKKKEDYNFLERTITKNYNNFSNNVRNYEDLKNEISKRIKSLESRKKKNDEKNEDEKDKELEIKNLNEILKEVEEKYSDVLKMEKKIYEFFSSIREKHISSKEKEECKTLSIEVNNFNEKLKNEYTVLIDKYYNIINPKK